MSLCLLLSQIEGPRAGGCPGNHKSAGKRLSGKARKGNPWVRLLLVQAVHAAVHSKNTYLAAQYHRLASRRGAKKAALAVAHSLLVIIYHLLRDQSTYQDLGGNYFDERDRRAVQKRLVRRLERMGCLVELQPIAHEGSMLPEPMRRGLFQKRRM